jgi:alkylhydroperoxidase family enzyme
MTDEQIAEMTRWAESGTFDEKEKAALAFAEQMTRDAKGVDDAMYAELRRHFPDSEIVELASVIGLFNYFNRVNDALKVDITK